MLLQRCLATCLTGVLIVHQGSASECLLKAGAEEEGVEDEVTEDLAGQPTPGNQVRKECHGEAVRGGKGGWQRWGVARAAQNSFSARAQVVPIPQQNRLRLVRTM